MFANYMTNFGELIQTEDGSWTIRHKDHGQNFHSTEGARFEAHQLYVVASGFGSEIERKDYVCVLDVGMGLGYNACATIAAWLESSGRANIDIFSLEHDLGLIEAVASGNAPWFKGWSEDWLIGPNSLEAVTDGNYCAQLTHPKTGRCLNWKILSGDGCLTVSKLQNNSINFIWQDPFTPELNPSMWSRQWFSKVLEKSDKDAVLMTYSVARIVKDALTQGGWGVQKISTPGRKRNWLAAKAGQ
jgi:tRNA U34 5-methylaminomethyl-2-thiouridine-forming methyltransferase MnmC